MPHSSPEPAARWFGGGLVRRTPSWGSALPGACRERGLFRWGAGRRNSCAESAVILPAVQSLWLASSEGLWGEREYGASRARACWER